MAMKTVRERARRMTSGLARFGLAACAAFLLAAGAHAAAPSAPPAPTAGAADGVGVPDLLNYLIGSGALSVDDAQKLVDRLRAEEQKKNADILLNYLVESKVLSLDDAQKLLNDLRSGKQPVKQVPSTSTDAATPPADDKAAKPAAADTDKAPANRIRSLYLPDNERARIKQEIRDEVMQTARKENWAQPDNIPGWVRRIKVSGEMLLRAEGDFLDHSNDPAINFQAINSGSPVDIFLPSTGTPQKVLTIPYLNTVDDRTAMKVRARLALQSEVSDRVDAGLRLATGTTTNPVSATQALGNDFNKSGFYLDRAWMRWQAVPALTMIGGRMANPWLAPTELIWDKDLSLDGAALQLKRAATPRAMGAFVTAGAFAVGNTDPNYPATSPFKKASRDQWLLGVQGGLERQGDSGFALRASGALYDFQHIEGELSSSCYAPTDKVMCDTDFSRTGFEQKGNTMFALRRLDRPNPATDPEYQYFGLAAAFRVLSANLGIDQPVVGAIHAQFDVDAARNLAFNPSHIKWVGPVNNFRSCPSKSATCPNRWDGGKDAWQAQVRVGHAKIAEAGQWNAVAGYRYVETDAVVDAFTDSDFHLGGTNARGPYVGGGLGLGHNFWGGLRYMTAREVSGWRYSADVLQLDLNARF